MRTIRISPYVNTAGAYEVRVSGKVVATLVLPVFRVKLGLGPSKDEIVSALRELGVPLVGEYRILRHHVEVK